MHSAVPWCNQDLFFLEHSVRRGRSVAEVAGFLCRDEYEVREKAKELGIPPPLLGVSAEAIGPEKRVPQRASVDARNAGADRRSTRRRTVSRIDTTHAPSNS
jgi:hypothetical protein